ncbi:hypothetical protein HA402_007146 [Bradysia odoriphaga]|nr:hypothetical protein HA402_007146 [Bradysia odoriphaga]
MDGEACELSVILGGIRNSCSSTLSAKAIDFLNKLVYFDLSDGIDDELCRLIISKWSARTDPKCDSVQKNEAKDVLQVLLDNNVLCEVENTNSNGKLIRIRPNLQEKLLAQNRDNLSFIVDLANILKNICIDWSGSSVYRQHMFHIHKQLKDLKWPHNTIELSVYLVAQLFCNDEDTIILDDVKEFFDSASNRQSRAIDWITVQMIQIYENTLSKSRKVLQPSDIVNVMDVDGVTQDIRLDQYGVWVLNQIQIHSTPGLQCDHAITSVAADSLQRLQKHARFCSIPDDLTLDWILAYGGREWFSFVCFAALACYQMHEWLTKLCRAYIRKLSDLCPGELSEKSQYSLKDLYLSWVCLRDLVKKSRVQQEFISALCDENGLRLLSMNFSKCETSLESKDYFIKYQAQTVIEILTPLLVNGQSEIVAKLLESQAFWSFIRLVLVKHPFISERYNPELENDLLCACEVYLDLLVAVCKRKDDAIADGFLVSFFTENYLETFTSVIRGAAEIIKPRQRDTCIYYLFTVLFAIFTHLKSNDVTDVYLRNDDIRKEIDGYSGSEDTDFEVEEGCLQEYRILMESFSDLCSNESKYPNVVRLISKMLKVPKM